MPHHVKMDLSGVYVVPNPVIAHPPAPSPELWASQLATVRWVGLEPGERLQHLSLDLRRELAEVALEYLRRDKRELRQLATAVDRAQRGDATDLAAPDLRR